MCKWPLILASVLTVNATFAQAPLRDPTRPLTAQMGEATEALVLHSVLISDRRKVAVVNGFTVREGDTLPNAVQWVVQKIERGAVVVTDAQQRRRLELAKRVSSGAIQKHDNQKSNRQGQGCHSSTCAEVKQ